MTTDRLSNAINDVIEVAVAIKDATADGKVRFGEGLAIAKEVFDLRDEMVNFKEIWKDWNASTDDDKLNIAFRVNENLHKSGLVSESVEALIEKSLIVVSSLDNLIDEVKKIRKNK
ncbi:MAG: hypothetical protein ACPGFK_00635 [Flavobacteriaceae bacterium]